VRGEEVVGLEGDAGCDFGWMVVADQSGPFLGDGGNVLDDEPEGGEGGGKGDADMASAAPDLLKQG
jgi:hypothetical protein